MQCTQYLDSEELTAKGNCDALQLIDSSTVCNKAKVKRAESIECTGNMACYLLLGSQELLACIDFTGGNFTTEYSHGNVYLGTEIYSDGTLQNFPPFPRTTTAILAPTTTAIGKSVTTTSSALGRMTMVGAAARMDGWRKTIGVAAGILALNL